jgi:nucleoporin POM152
MYNIARSVDSGGTRLLDQPVFNSIQPRTRFQLHTSEPGRIYYEVKQVGDTAYPLSKHKGVVIPRSDRPLFEQEVLMRPSARFATPNRLSYCLNENFVPQDKVTGNGAIVLQGTPPFELTILVQNFAASERFVETVRVHDTTWRLDLPGYDFKSVGQHKVSIEAVKDASHCEQKLPDSHDRSIWIDVAESAAIIPFDRREYFCVGEVAHFQLEGIPPWTIGWDHFLQVLAYY